MSTSALRPILALTPQELEEHLVSLGGRAHQARDLRRTILERGVFEFESMTFLPKLIREQLAQEFQILTGEETARTKARDGTTKLLIEFPRIDGRSAAVETVHIPPHRANSTKGATLCVSTQAGCPVGCPFCASGLEGLSRNLEAHEILEQYLRGRTIGDLSRSVVMGIGEPLLNYPNLTRALDAVHDEMGMGTRKITVSTVGFPDRLRRIAPEKPRFQLAISLHTADQEQRDELVPAMAGVPIEDILSAGDFWFECTGREVTYEYVMLGDDNTSPGHAERLAERLRGRRCSVNLIPFNTVRESPYRRPHQEDVDGFQQFLTDAGIVATIRWSRGLEDDAACGQLRLRSGTR